MGGLNFYTRDLYPTLGKVDTRTQVQPEASDKVALEDSPKATERVKNEKQTSGKKIFMAIALLAIMAFVLGAAK